MQKYKQTKKKLVETLHSLDYFELSKEALELAIKNKGIAEIILEDEYEESNYEETSHMMKNN